MSALYRETTNVPATRNGFRENFQPSRIVLGVLPAPMPSGVNVITLCFHMHCSYKPRMMAIAIQDNAASQHWIENADEFVLAVPGPTLLNETIYCGVRSARNVDKVKELGIETAPAQAVSVPIISKAIANVELAKEQVIRTGDHVLVVGRVMAFGVNPEIKELPLVSIGPNLRGYKLLAHKGQHRIATVEDGTRGDNLESFF